MADQKSSSDGLRTVLITGLLALFGTIGGGLLQGYWADQVAKQDFEARLVLSALQTKNVDDRIKSLNFLVSTHLLRDPEIIAGIRATVNDRQSVPIFSGSSSSVVIPGPGSVMIPAPGSVMLKDGGVFTIGTPVPLHSPR
jgi:hypothetical protein